MASCEGCKSLDNSGSVLEGGGGGFWDEDWGEDVHSVDLVADVCRFVMDLLARHGESVLGVIAVGLILWSIPAKSQRGLLSAIRDFSPEVDNNDGRVSPKDMLIDLESKLSWDLEEETSIIRAACLRGVVNIQVSQTRNYCIVHCVLQNKLEYVTEQTMRGLQ